MNYFNPEIHKKYEDPDRLMARELTKLSLEKREQVLHDVHGINDTKSEETPEFISRKLEELQAALDEKVHAKTGYEVARRINSDYVQNAKFRLMFLRAVHYDPVDAAERLARHFEWKLELFGEDLLCKDVTQDDLDEGTIKCLYSNWVQDLPLRDMAGRTVSIVNTETQGWALKEKLRRTFYDTMCLAEDEDAQKKGRVLIVWVYAGVALNPRNSVALSRLNYALPIRFSGIHFCLVSRHASNEYGPPIAAYRLALETFTMLRVKLHLGSPLELKYTLASFGIPINVLPIDDGGNVISNAENLKWAKRRLDEQRRATPNVSTTMGEIVLTPSNNDVLLGRGRWSQDHVGNVRFRHLLDEYQDLYDKASRREKTSMAVHIVKVIQSRNGHFLDEDETGWFEISDLNARKKVANAFRTARHRRKKDPSDAPSCSVLSVKKDHGCR